MKIAVSFFLCLLLLLFPSCEEEEQTMEEGKLVVIAFNVQNLFDDVETGTEYAEYRKSGGWTTALYEKRISLFQALFRKQAYSTADIIFLEEVESENVLKALLDRGLRSRGFLYYGIVQDDNPISVGYISKLNVSEVTLQQAGSQRPFLCLDLLKEGHQFLVCGLHAKSNVGDDEKNRELRQELARHINFLGQFYHDVPLLLVGDFNTEPVLDASDMLSDIACVPAETARKKGSVPISGERCKAVDIIFYDPSYDVAMPVLADGSYYYQGKWYQYDRALVNACLAQSSMDVSFAVLGDDTADAYGLPESFDSSSGTGYSDHFPIRLTVAF